MADNSNGFSSTLIFYVNGKKVQEANVDPEWTLLSYLRDKLGLVGTKLACGEGGCGACTVMLSKIIDGKVRHYAVNACLFPLASIHATSVTTVEGIGSCKTKLHPLQERMAKAHGSQCGFCTPGFIMSAYALLRSKDTPPTMEEMEDALVGNLCRCTGYRPILEAFKTFTDEGVKNGCGRKDCCKLKSNGTAATDSDDMVMSEVLYDAKSFAPYDPTQELIFPPELKMNPMLGNQALKFSTPRVQFYQTDSFHQVLQIKDKYPHAKLVVGNTELGVETRFKNQLYPVLVNINSVPELKKMEVLKDGLLVGAAVSLSDLKEKMEKLIEELPKWKTGVLTSIVEMLKWFAGKQIRNVACLGGNILTCSPISDINPILLAAKAELHFEGLKGGKRNVTLESGFFTSYRKCQVLEDEVLVNVKIPFTREGEFFKCFKQARRREDDIAIVNAAMRVMVDRKTHEVQEATLAFGGVAAITIVAEKASKGLVGKKWSEESLAEKCIDALMMEIDVPYSAPGGMTAYRNCLVPSFFFKFYTHVTHELKLQHVEGASNSALKIDTDLNNRRYEKKATHFYQKVSASQPLIDPVGRPLAHSTASEQCTGEALYVDDIPRYSNELHLGFVLSSRSKAKILNVDAKAALAIEGVHLYLSEKDLPGLKNSFVDTLEEVENTESDEETIADETIFARDAVICVGQLIGVIVAETPEVAERAAKLVKVEYGDPDTPPIITIEDAIKAKSYIGTTTIKSGNPEAVHKVSDHTLTGEVRIGGQEHFYLEPNAHLAVPKGAGEMEIITSNQSLSDAQAKTAFVLGVPANKIVAKIKRLGGAFGGKETRGAQFFVPCAIASSLTNRPVRCVVDRHTDMLMTGGRHPFLGKWKVSFTKEGKIKAIDVEFYSNIGCTLDISLAVLHKALFSVDASFKCENLQVTGRCCITNLPSNTAFRGFGAPQAVIIMESILTQVADHLHMDMSQLRRLNFYEAGDVTYLGVKLERCAIKECWEQVMTMAQYDKRKLEIDNFNQNHRYVKRGIADGVVQFCIGYFVPFMNQGGALVMIYKDGSVLVNHGGTEMGQGLHIKMIQVASRVLGVSHEDIHIAETSTDKVPNPLPTAASVSSDLFGQAVKNACTTLIERLEPYKKKSPNGSWKEWVRDAYFGQTCLSAVGHYGVQGTIPWDFTTQKGKPFLYFTSGAAVTEVEIDCLTGDHEVLRTDIVMDVGDSLNPAIDIGQIEGAFVQGQGLFTLEELRYSPDGTLLTRGPGMYKLPGVSDIPNEFNVTLLRDSPNPKAVYSSRGIGEPPIVLATSVVSALKKAITAARKDGGVEDPYFRLDTPVTAERIRMHCQDFITKKINNDVPTDVKPWDITV